MWIHIDYRDSMQSLSSFYQVFCDFCVFILWTGKQNKDTMEDKNKVRGGILASPKTYYICTVIRMV